MKSSLEPDDIKAIAEAVIERLRQELSYYNNKSSFEEIIMDVEDLSLYLKVKTAWVYQQTHVNAIPFIKVGNLLRFRKSAIDDWLNKNKTPAIDD